MDLVAKALRFLAVDAVNKAKSGHPGLPLGMAEVATVLWKNFLRVNPRNPRFVNRDRFVLSNGHGSILLYSLLHLAGFPITMDDLANFRQLHSKTPGHPEYDLSLGIETTTGPLGQGFANGVGMALAEKWLSEEFNHPGYPIIDHYTYVFVGDGCLMEGISHEVASLAGTHRLNKLIVFWDDNGISIDGEVKNWCKDDVEQRFKAYGWDVLRCDGNGDLSAIDEVIRCARSSDKPVLIACKTKIGFGCKFAGQAKVHGAPLDQQTISEMRQELNWPYLPFVLPEEIYREMDLSTKGEKIESAWNELWNKYQFDYPDQAAVLSRYLGSNGILSDEVFNEYLEKINLENLPLATRKSSEDALNFFAKYLPNLLGGSADLTPSNLTKPSNAQDLFPKDAKQFGKIGYFHYGVREFGMFAVMNGIALHGGYLPYGGGFLVFAGYGENGIRMSAIMKLRVIYVFTHDSIGVGEDGPTHQPVEHLTMLRAIPDLQVFRPGNRVEVFVAWKKALDYNGPSVLALSRQKVFSFFYEQNCLSDISKGGYILWENDSCPDLILIASGSELGLAYETAKLITDKNIKVRVVSMWSQEIFDQQTADYQVKVLPLNVKKVAIEAGNGLSWYKYVKDGKVISLESFGLSAPDKELFEYFGFTPEKVLAKIFDEN